MATRKTKRYDEGGMAPEMGALRAPNQEAPIGPSGEDGFANLAKMMGKTKEMRMPNRIDDSIGPRNAGYMDDYRVPNMRLPRPPMDNEPPMKRGNNDLAGQLTKLMGGSTRGAGDGVPLGQKAMGTSDGGISPMGTSDDGPANLAAMMGRAKKGVGIPAMPPQDTGPERIIGEPMPDDVERARPMPMVDAVKNIMGRRGRNPGRARAMGAGMGGFSAGGSVSSASKRGDGIAQKGKTRGKMC